MQRCNWVLSESFMSHSRQRSHFRDVRPSQFLGLVLKEWNKMNKANDKGSKWAWVHTLTHTIWILLEQEIVAHKWLAWLRKKNRQEAKPKRKQTVSCRNCSSAVCTWMFTVVVHNAAKNSSDHIPHHPLDNHNYSDLVCCSGDGSLLRVVHCTVNCKQDRTRWLQVCKYFHVLPR